MVTVACKDRRRLFVSVNRHGLGRIVRSISRHAERIIARMEALVMSRRQACLPAIVRLA